MSYFNDGIQYYTLYCYQWQNERTELNVVTPQVQFWKDNVPPAILAVYE